MRIINISSFNKYFVRGEVLFIKIGAGKSYKSPHKLAVKIVEESRCSVFGKAHQADSVWLAAGLQGAAERE